MPSVKQYTAKNEQKIKKAFGSLVFTKDYILTIKLPTIMRDAINAALDIHEQENHPMHLEIGDSYGWIIAKDGKAIAKEVHGVLGSKATSGVSQELDRVIDDSIGWSAWLMAGMNTVDGKLDYFSVRFEVEVLEMVADMVQQEVLKLLKTMYNGKRS